MGPVQSIRTGNVEVDAHWEWFKINSLGKIEPVNGFKSGVIAKFDKTITESF